MIQMGAVKFEWDATKNLANKKKHGVSFEEATTVFLSVPLLVFHDPDHSLDEDRFLAVGMSLNQRVLVVVHCENEVGNVVRIISARRATKKEQKNFSRGDL